MQKFFENVFSGFGITDAIDILIIAFVIYKVLGFIRQTRAEQLLKGVIVLVVATFVSEILNLHTLNWILKGTMALGAVAILVVFGSFMFCDQDLPDTWTLIFGTIGTAVTALGIAGFFLIRDSAVPVEQGSYFANIFYGFRPAVIRANPTLYLALAVLAVFNISISTFMPYLILYYTEALGMENYVLIFAPAILVSAAFTALYGRVYDRRGFQKAVIPTLALLGAGYVLLYCFRATVPVFIGSLVMMCGYLGTGAMLGALVRDRTPAGKAGMFQGQRIIHQVLLPGIIGPAIGAAVLQNAETVVNSDGTTSFIPNASIFLAALAVLAVLVPVLLCCFRALRKEAARVAG